MLRALLLVITILFVGLAAIAQPPRFRESAEPPLADGSVQQAGGQLRATVPTNIDTPVVSIDVVAPPFVPNGKNIDYRLRVANLSAIEARDVVVVYQMPKGGKFVKSDPVAKEDVDKLTLTWELGALAGGARKEIAMTVTPGAEMTEWAHIAKVRFEHGRQGKTKIARPEVSVKVVGPTAVQQHDVVSLRLEVTNTGLMEVRDVVITNNLAKGLAHQYDPSPPGQKQDATKSPTLRTWTIARLGPSEARVFDFRVVAEDAGNHNQTLTSNISNGAKHDTTSLLTVQAPKLELRIDGPTKRGSHQTATYRVTVRNLGNAPLRNVTLTDKVPMGCEVVSVSEGGQNFERDIQWILPQLQPNEAKVVELTVKASGIGQVRHVFAASSRGMREEKEAVTDFIDIAALQMDVNIDPQAVVVGDNVRFVLTVRNLGSAAATRVLPALVLPSSLSYVSAEPTLHQHVDGRIAFEPISIVANGVHKFVVTAKAVRAALPAVVSADLMADQLEAGKLRREESLPISDPRRGP